jgi:hypothetical protein
MMPDAGCVTGSGAAIPTKISDQRPIPVTHPASGIILGITHPSAWQRTFSADCC